MDIFEVLKGLEDEGRYEELLKLSIKALRTEDLVIDDELLLYEYIILSALEYGQFKWVQYSIEQLHRKINKESRRVKRFDMKISNDVNKLLTQGTLLLSSQTHDLKTRKTIISTFKDDSNTVQYVDVLNYHLNDYPTDYESWHELAIIYIQQQHYLYAIHCIDECILEKSRNLYYFVTLAELYSSLNDNIIAVKYFSFVVLMKDDFLRALWGIVISGFYYKNTKGSEVTEKLHKAIISKLINIYNTQHNILAQTCLSLLHKLEKS